MGCVRYGIASIKEIYYAHLINNASLTLFLASFLCTLRREFGLAIRRARFAALRITLHLKSCEERTTVRIIIVRRCNLSKSEIRLPNRSLQNSHFFFCRRFQRRLVGARRAALRDARRPVAVRHRRRHRQPRPEHRGLPVPSDPGEDDTNTSLDFGEGAIRVERFPQQEPDRTVGLSSNDGLH